MMTPAERLLATRQRIAMLDARYKAALVGMKQAARNAGVMLGRTFAGHQKVKEQVQSDLRAAARTALDRNANAREAMRARADAEVWRVQAALLGRALQLKQAELAQLLRAGELSRGGYRESPALNAAEALAVESAQSEAAASSVAGTIVTLKLPHSMSKAKSAKIARAIGLDDAKDVGPVPVPFSPPVAMSIATEANAQKFAFLPRTWTSMYRTDASVQCATGHTEAALAGLLGSDLGATVMVKDLETGKTETLQATADDITDLTCDFWCIARKAFIKVGPAAGVSVAAAGGAVGQKNASVGTALAAAGGLLAALSATMGGEVNRGFAQGKGMVVGDGSSALPWLIGGVVLVGGTALLLGRRT